MAEVGEVVVGATLTQAYSLNGTLTTSSSVTVTAGGLTVTAGDVTFSDGRLNVNYDGSNGIRIINNGGGNNAGLQLLPDGVGNQSTLLAVSGEDEFRITQSNSGTTQQHVVVDTNNGGAFGLPRMTTANRDLLADPVVGYMIFNTTTATVQAITSVGPTVWTNL